MVLAFSVISSNDNKAFVLLLNSDSNLFLKTYAKEQQNISLKVVLCFIYFLSSNFFEMFLQFFF